ncbi:hypothetical protein [Thiocapsa rosea]|uniref:Uncharacterized protein n=1 Tax=Thiocapsa rosea TaxID=69360 RepID=A0A495V576_9GAMM|nr:hypothetical protein [Thiocapsa rosea]RKT44444.1 hypothetical protein BDD21_1826 [Thiocapsa rosea]
MTRQKTTKLALAIGALMGGAAMAPTASAVHLTTDGLGEALIVPYYTVRDGYNTLFNITNTSAESVVVKVRFHEAYNSRDILDFNIVLSPEDVWTGYVTDGAAGPVLMTGDNSCTVPAIPATGAPLSNGVIAYTDTAATGGVDAEDGGPTDVNRLKEGYVEFLMMGSGDPATSILAADAVHINGVPRNCARIRTAFGPGNADFTGGSLADIRGVNGFPNYTASPLKGVWSLVNGGIGVVTAGGEMTTLANFYDPTLQPVSPMMTLQVPPGPRPGFPEVAFADSYHQPSLSSANTVGSYVDIDGIQVIDPTDATGADAVSFAMLRDTLANLWTRLDSTGSTWNTATDWVVTFPTKRYYVDNDPTVVYAGRFAERTGLPAGLAPFTEDFSETIPGASCDPVSWTIWDREEFTPPPPPPSEDPVFSPSPTPQPLDGPAICEEVNVISFGATGDTSMVLGSEMMYNVADLPGPNGWMRLTFENDALPVTGFAIVNRTLPGVGDSVAYPHSYTRPELD